MRRQLALLLVLALLLGSLSGCTEPASSVEPGEPVQEGDILSDAIDVSTKAKVDSFGLAYHAEFGFNPYNCNDLNNRTIFSLLYEPLFTVTSTFDVEPVLCDYFTVSEDQKTYTVTLMDNVYFTDGSKLTAEDVSASYDAARDSDVYGSRLRYVYSVDAKDSRTVVFRLTQAYESLQMILDIPITKAVTVEDITPVGTGPYRVAATNDGTQLLRNNNWWQEYEPAVTVSSVRLVETDSPIDVRDDFEYGATGVVCTDPNSAVYVDYHGDYELWNCSTTIMDYIGFNMAAGLFSDASVRAAFTHLLDRETIATEVYKGYAEPAVLPCHPLSRMYDTTLAAKYGYDPQRLKTAISGYTQLGSVRFLVCSSDPGRVAAAEMIAREAEKWGLEMEIIAKPTSEFLYAVNHGGYDLFYGETRLAPNFDLTSFFNGGSLSTYGLYRGDLLELCRDALENSGNYYSLHESIMSNGLICPVLFKSYAVYATRGIITNMVPALDNIFHTSNGRALTDALAVEQEEPTDPEEPSEDEEVPEDEDETESDVPEG